MSITSNGLIKAPVNIESDLGFVLGTGSGDIGYNIVYGNINPWAIYKSVCSPEIGYISNRNSLEKLGFPALWEYNTNGEMGIPYATTISDLVALYSLENNGWYYKRPRGPEQNEYFRVADFCKGRMSSAQGGYNPQAKNPFGNLVSASPSSVSHYYGKTNIAQNRRIVIGNYPDTDLTIYDFNQFINESIKMKYYGCVISFPSSYDNYHLFGNSTAFIGQNVERGKEELSYNLELTPSLFQTLGSYTIYPCISNLELGYNVNLVDGQRLYSLPNVTPITMIVIDSLITINVSAIAEEDGANSYYVYWSFTINNNSTSAITVTNGAVRFRKPGKSFDDTMVSGEVEITSSQVSEWSSITIPSGSSYSYNPQLGIALSDFSLSQLIVRFGHNSGAITGSRTFITPIQPEL